MHYFTLFLVLGFIDDVIFIHSLSVCLSVSLSVCPLCVRTS